MNRRSPAALYLPGGLLFLGLFILPMAGLFIESLRFYQPGSIGSAADAPLTTENYAELLRPSFVRMLWQTISISFLASMAGVALAFPLAYWVSRHLGQNWRRAALGLLVTLMFLSVLVRTYALELTFGAAGPFGQMLRDYLGVATNGRFYIQILVGLGLLHYIVPMSTLTLLGTVDGVDPRLTEAAQVLGAPAWKAHLGVTLPLCLSGVLASFLFAFTFSISAFVIPMILGKGRVLFISNLIYTRFSEIANYPSGAAISVVLFTLAMTIVYVMTRIVTRGRRA